MSARPQLALSLPLHGVGTREGVSLAQELAGAGFAACWTSEVQGPDAFTTLGALAVTTDLELGVAVVPAQTRTPMVLAMSAVSLAELSGGRFTLGIGASSELIVERWAGQPFERPLTAVRETVAALRPVLAGGRSPAVDGAVVTGEGYRAHTTPPAGRVPLVLAALNPASCRLVGELGVDGICLNQLAPHHVPRVLAEVATGAGSPLPDGYRVVARLFCAVTDDVPAARAAIRTTFAPYVAARAYNRFYRWMGFTEEAQAVLDAFGDRDAMARAFSDRLVDELFCVGDADTVAARIAAYTEAGVTVPVIQPIAPDGAAARRMLQAIATAYR